MVRIWVETFWKNLGTHSFLCLLLTESKSYIKVLRHESLGKALATMWWEDYCEQTWRFERFSKFEVEWENQLVAKLRKYHQSARYLQKWIIRHQSPSMWLYRYLFCRTFCKQIGITVSFETRKADKETWNNVWVPLIQNRYRHVNKQPI